MKNNTELENLDLEMKKQAKAKLFDRPPLRWNSDELRLILVMMSDRYSAMSDEELSDITPFDVLNHINNLI